MPATLLVRDDPLTGAAPPAGEDDDTAWEFTPPTETMTVRALIRERVFQESKDRAAGVGGRRPLVTPAAREAALNGPRTGQPAPAVDWKRQFEVACEAFEAGRILVLIDDEQAEALDDTFDVATTSEVTFVRLTLLVGG